MTAASQDAQEQAILSRAKRNLAVAKACPVPECKGCHGFLTNVEAHEEALIYTARMTGLRAKGWNIVCLRMRSKVNLFHIVGRDPVQQDLETGETLRKLTVLPSGIEMYEVLK